MKPYALEGLDCSGKKTVAPLVQKLLRKQGIDATIVIGPLIGGGIGRLDAQLANITAAVPRGSPTDLLRRSLYVAEPIIDRLCPTQFPKPILKVSTHFRAWARALLERDHCMVRFFTMTAAFQLRFVGATLLSTDFQIRMQRHSESVATGATAKVATRRFLGPDPAAFTEWQRSLDRLMETYIPEILRLDTSEAHPELIAEHVANHAATCWSRET